MDDVCTFGTLRRNKVCKDIICRHSKNLRMNMPNLLENIREINVQGKLNPDNLTEANLILYRTGFFDGPRAENLSQFTICGHHRKELGYNFSYKGGFCCLKRHTRAYHQQQCTIPDRVVDLEISRAIYYEKQELVPIGSGEQIG